MADWKTPVAGMRKKSRIRERRGSNIVLRHFDRIASEIEAQPDRSCDEFAHLRVSDVKDLLIGTSFMLVIGAMTALLYNIVKVISHASDGCYAPTIVVWSRCLLRILTFPLYLLGYRLCCMQSRWCRRGPEVDWPDTKQRALDGCNLYGTKQTVLWRMAWDILLMGLLSVAMQYFSFVPINSAISVGNLTALATSNIVFVFFLSIYYMKKSVKPVKILGLLAALSGMATLLLIEVVTNPRWSDSTNVIWSAIATAGYQMMYKMRVGGTTDLAKINFSTTLFAFVGSALMWPVALGRRFAGPELYQFHTFPYMAILGSSLAAAVLGLLINFGISRVNPLFTSVGFVLAIPFSYALDYIIKGYVPFASDIAGGLLVFVGCLLLVLGDMPDHESINKKWTALLVAPRKLVRRLKSNFGKPTTKPAKPYR